jgi:hypothetical protein
MKKVVWLLCVMVIGACSASDDDGPGGLLDRDGGLDGPAGGTGGSGGAGGSSGSNAGGSGGTSGTDDSDGGVDTWNPTGITDGGVPMELWLCGDMPCQCGDGMDNDGDGVADGFDTECTGPNDNDEGTFATGISGDNMDPFWQDCFFDGNSGAGDDHCRYHTDCLTGDKEADDADCQVTQDCVDFCKQRTPNGCDCFGCCSITIDDGTSVDVLISESCEEENLDECTPCTKTENACNNECGECELCPGKTVADLPDSCFMNPPTGGSGGSGGVGGTGGVGGAGGTGGSDPPPYTCDNDAEVCAATSDCNLGMYCSFGCCLVIPPQ